MFHTRFNPPRVKGVDFKSAPTLTQAHFAKDCDVGKMVARYLSGDVSVINRRVRFGDFSYAPDSLHDAMNINSAAETAWQELPDSVRRAYGNYSRFIQALDKAEEDRRKALKNPLNPSEKPSEKPSDVTPKGAEVSNTEVHTSKTT